MSSIESLADTAILLGVLFIIGSAFFTISIFKHKNAFVVKRPLKAKTYRGHRQPKPRWVRRELIRIKAHVPLAGVRQVADIFNRNFAPKTGVSVGKTFVYKILRDNIYEVKKLRKKWKRRVPKPMAKNIVWGMDMTGIEDTEGTTKTVFGILDHGTRKCLSLKSISDKASITLLKALITAIEAYGKPKSLRTDNESVFVSKLFRFGLWILGIRHQRSHMHSPWENGRIERFFGTFKFYSDRVFFNAKKIQFALDEFQFWYNTVRPHRHLGGLTPEEVWTGLSPFVPRRGSFGTKAAKLPSVHGTPAALATARLTPGESHRQTSLASVKRCTKFSGWNGLLKGYLLDYR